MPRTQQDESRKTFVVPVVVPKPVDLSKVDFKDSSLFDQALKKRIEVLESLVFAHADEDEITEAKSDLPKQNAETTALSADEIRAKATKRLADLRREAQEIENSLKPTDPNSKNPTALL